LDLGTYLDLGPWFLPARPNAFLASFRKQWSFRRDLTNALAFVRTLAVSTIVVYLLSIPEEVLFTICGLGFLQGVFLAILLYTHPKSNKSVNGLLALYILFVSSFMTFPLIMRLVTWRNSAFIVPLPLLIGPFLFLYLRSFRERVTFKRAWPHFVIFVLFFIPAYLNIDYNARKYPDATQLTAEILRSPTTLALFYFRLAHLIVYYFLSRRELLFYQRSIKHMFSETSHIDLQWARLLINGFLCLVIGCIIIFPLMALYPDKFYLLLLILVAIGTPYIYMVSLKGITQPCLWQLQNEAEKKEMENAFHEAQQFEMEKGQKKKIDINSSDPKLQTIVKNVIALMEVEKLYHEPELTLQQLANRLQMPTYLVSQAINDRLNKNFYELINQYRVEEAKKLLLEPKNANFTILSIGFEAGFNSKTTFNTVFKKFTGQTPTEFREQSKMNAAVA